MSDFACTTCDYSTADIKEGMGHAVSTNHHLTREVDDEGTTMTIRVSPADEVLDDWEDGEW